MTLAIMQPYFLPYLGYFQLIARHRPSPSGSKPLIPRSLRHRSRLGYFFIYLPANERLPARVYRFRKHSTPSHPIKYGVCSGIDFIPNKGQTRHTNCAAKNLPGTSSEKINVRHNLSSGADWSICHMGESQAQHSIFQSDLNS
jgi:hypothetical protein